MQLLIIPPLSILVSFVLVIALILVAWVVTSARKKANELIKINYQWDPWHHVWYYIVSIREEGDMIIPGVQLSSNKEGTGYVEVYSFRDYSMRGAIDHFRRESTKRKMLESVSKKIS